MATFSDFKKNFYSRFENVGIFDCEEVNLLKVVLDGLKVKYASRGKYRAYAFFPPFFYHFFLFLKIKLSKTTFDLEKCEQKILNFSKVKYCVSDIGRIVYGANEVAKSLYFDKIVNVLGRENTVIILDQIKKKSPDFDIEILELKTNAHFLPEDTSVKLFRKNLRNTYKTIRKSGKFRKDELKNIKIAFHNFFIEYKVWSFCVSKLSNITKCYFICHYHKEGQILALKRKGIECIELQHGLIATQDIFYVFPEIIKNIRHKCLFADKIFVYGEYWKNILLKGYEYMNSQIETIGYYLYDDFSGNVSEKNCIENLIEKKEVVLITTQTFIHEHFIKYTLSLAERLNKENKNILFLVKPHPAEDANIYLNAFSNTSNIKVINFPLPLLFEKIKIHISVYSTTLYDAIRHEVTNFVFKAKGYEDYVDEILKSGIACELTEDCNPFNLVAHSHHIDKEYYFSSFKKELIN